MTDFGPSCICWCQVRPLVCRLRGCSCIVHDHPAHTCGLEPGGVGYEASPENCPAPHALRRLRGWSMADQNVRTGLPCGCTFVKAGRQWWHVVACPAHKLDLGPIADPLTPSADLPACRDEDPATPAVLAAAYPDPPEYQHPEDDQNG